MERNRKGTEGNRRQGGRQVAPFAQQQLRQRQGGQQQAAARPAENRVAEQRAAADRAAEQRAIADRAAADRVAEQQRQIDLQKQKRKKQEDDQREQERQAELALQKEREKLAEKQRLDGIESERKRKEDEEKKKATRQASQPTPSSHFAPPNSRSDKKPDSVIRASTSSRENRGAPLPIARPMVQNVHDPRVEQHMQEVHKQHLETRAKILAARKNNTVKNTDTGKDEDNHPKTTSDPEIEPSLQMVHKAHLDKKANATKQIKPQSITLNSERNQTPTSSGLATPATSSSNTLNVQTLPNQLFTTLQRITPNHVAGGMAADEARRILDLTRPALNQLSTTLQDLTPISYADNRNPPAGTASPLSAGYAEVFARADGGCLYNSLSIGLVGDESLNMALRLLELDHVLQNEQGITPRSRIDFGLDYQNLVHRTAQPPTGGPETWGSSHSFRFLNLVLGRPIENYVRDPTTNQLTRNIYNADPATAHRRPLMVYQRGNHYNAIIPTAHNPPNITDRSHVEYAWLDHNYHYDPDLEPQLNEQYLLQHYAAGQQYMLDMFEDINEVREIDQQCDAALKAAQQHAVSVPSPDATTQSSQASVTLGISNIGMDEEIVCSSDEQEDPEEPKRAEDRSPDRKKQRKYRKSPSFEEMQLSPIESQGQVELEEPVAGPSNSNQRVCQDEKERDKYVGKFNRYGNKKWIEEIGKIDPNKIHSGPGYCEKCGKPYKSLSGHAKYKHKDELEEIVEEPSNTNNNNRCQNKKDPAYYFGRVNKCGKKEYIPELGKFVLEELVQSEGYCGKCESPYGNLYIHAKGKIHKHDLIHETEETSKDEIVCSSDANEPEEPSQDRSTAGKRSPNHLENIAEEETGEIVDVPSNRNNNSRCKDRNDPNNYINKVNREGKMKSIPNGKFKLSRISSSRGYCVKCKIFPTRLSSHARAAVHRQDWLPETEEPLDSEVADSDIQEPCNDPTKKAHYIDKKNQAGEKMSIPEKGDFILSELCSGIGFCGKHDRIVSDLARHAQRFHQDELEDEDPEENKKEESSSQFNPNDYIGHYTKYKLMRWIPDFPWNYTREQFSDVFDGWCIPCDRHVNSVKRHFDTCPHNRPNTSNQVASTTSSNQAAAPTNQQPIASTSSHQQPVASPSTNKQPTASNEMSWYFGERNEAGQRLWISIDEELDADEIASSRGHCERCRFTYEDINYHYQFEHLGPQPTNPFYLQFNRLGRRCSVPLQPGNYSRDDFHTGEGYCRQCGEDCFNLSQHYFNNHTNKKKEKLNRIPKDATHDTHKSQDFTGRMVKGFCEICHRDVPQRLDQHFDSHSGPVSCPLCSSILSHMHLGKKHITRMHNTTFRHNPPVILSPEDADRWRSDIERRRQLAEDSNRQIIEKFITNIPKYRTYMAQSQKPQNLRASFNTMFSYDSNAIISAHTSFVSVWDRSNYIPHLVFQVVRRLRTTDRYSSSQYAPDPEIAAPNQPKRVDYKNSGYDQGHLAAAGNFDDYFDVFPTYFYTNIVPMRDSLNRGVYLDMERHIRALARQHGEVHAMHFPILGQNSQPVGISARVPLSIVTIVGTRSATGLRVLGAWNMPQTATYRDHMDEYEVEDPVSLLQRANIQLVVPLEFDEVQGEDEDDEDV